MKTQKTKYSLNKEIFQKASITYYNSSIFFSKKNREDIFTLYAFVRTADDLVDKENNKKKFLEFKKEYLQKNTKNPIIKNFIQLETKKKFDPKWTKAFLKAMQSDFTKKKYLTYKELEQYMYGSAEVIGLMIAKILGLKKESYEYAKLQGKAMQLINFVRDIKEDTKLKRQYIPQEWLEQFKIKSLKNPDPEKFSELINYAINKYLEIQQEAQKGYKYIKRKDLIPIKTAAQMYNYTAKKIQTNPLIVLNKKIKPTKLKVILTILRNTIWTN